MKPEHIRYWMMWKSCLWFRHPYYRMKRSRHAESDRGNPSGVYRDIFSKASCFFAKDHPLASKKVVSVHDLAPYPRLNFVQGEYESVYFSEELFSSIRWIRKFGSMTEGLLSTSCSDWMPILFQVAFPEIFERRNIISVPLARKWNNAYWICVEWKSGIKWTWKKLSGRITEICSSQSIVIGYG